MAQKNPVPLKAVLFDFDGVILESAGIKTRAFGELFRGFPRHRKDILLFHKSRMGISRYVKFDHIYKNILRRPLTSAARRRLGRDFAELIQKKMRTCPLVPGAKELLQRKPIPFDCFVISGTPQKELRDIVRRRRLGRFFCGVYGSPKTKRDLADSVLKRYGWKPRELLFVGDAREDYLAARGLGIPFVGRVRKGESSPFPSTVRVVKDLSTLSDMILRTSSAV